MSLLAHRLRPYPSHTQTVISELGRAVLGTGPVYVVLQVATAAILTLAANTAFADFPRLSSIVARDGFAPRQLAKRSDRLVFTNGILVLAGAAAVLFVAFGGKTDALVPLYAVGVFTAFTLSQIGMVRHHRRRREPGWRRGLAVNAVGAASTFVVLIIVAATKFVSGAWIPMILVPVIVAGFVLVRRYYDHLEEALVVSPAAAAPHPKPHTVVVMVGQLHLGIINALNYARGLRPDHLLALHVCIEGDDGTQLAQRWRQLGIDVPLESVNAAHRDIGPAVEDHIKELLDRWPGTALTVVISQYAGGGIFDDVLHNQTLGPLRERLMVRDGIVVASVPYRMTADQTRRARHDTAGAVPPS